MCNSMQRTASASPSNQMRPGAPGSARRIEKVGGGWSFAPDPQNEGLKHRWKDGPPPDAFQIEVGMPWEYWCPGYDGVAWYWKDISFNNWPEGQVKLIRFDAVSYWSEYWLNGKSLGIHEGGYDPFTLDVSERLVPGRNLLAARVINPPADREIEGLRSGTPLGQSDLPTGKAAWYFNFGGIWSHVWLESAPAIRLKDFWVDANPAARQLTLHWTVSNRGAAEDCGLGIVIKERATGRTALVIQIPVEIAGGETMGSRRETWTDFVEWSPENPSLYVAEAALQSTGGEHVVEKTFGVRSFSIGPAGFVLNGCPIRLMGVLQQGAYPRRIAGPHHWRMAVRELLLLKRAGMNFIRIHLKPGDRWYVDIADRLGILTMVEPPLGWIANGPSTEARIAREVKAMVIANRGHASIVLWGIFNESFHLLGYTPEDVRGIAIRMMQIIREMDGTRPVIDTSGGYARAAGAGADTMIHDTFTNGPASYSINGGAGTGEILDAHVYCPMPPDVKTIEDYRRLDPGALPLFISEYGAAETPPDFPAVMARYSSEERNRGLEDFQLHADFHESLSRKFSKAGLSGAFGSVAGWIDAVNRVRAQEIEAITLAIRCNPHVDGACFCQLADASGELFGLLDFWRRPKPVYAALARALGNPAIGLVAGKRWVNPGEPVRITFAAVSDRDEPLVGAVQCELVAPSGEVIARENKSFRCHSGTPGENTFLFTPKTPGVHETRASITLPEGRKLECSAQVGVLSDELVSRIVAGRFAQEGTEDSLRACGITVEPLGNNYREKDNVLLLEWAAIAKSVQAHEEMLGQVRNVVGAGGAAVIFEPDAPMLQRWLLPHFIGVRSVMRESVYIKESPVFAGLPSNCVADMLYAEILPGRWDDAEDVMAAGGAVEVGTLSMNMWTRPAKYFWGAGLYRIPLGRGNVFICHLKLLDKLTTSLLARRVLTNLVDHARSLIAPGGHDILNRRCIDRIGVDEIAVGQPR